MKKIYLIVCLLALSVAGLGAQARADYKGEIDYANSVVKQGNTVSNDFTIDFGNIKLGRQEMVILTPTVRAKDGKWSEALPSIVIAGPKRYRMMMRDMGFGVKVFDNEPSMILKNGRNIDKKLALEWDLAYSAWHRNAEFLMIEEVCGCPACEHTVNNVKVSDMLPPIYVPKYGVSFINPPVEEVKARSESHLAYLNYEVGKYRLLRNYKNNAEVLDQVDKIMRELMNDPDLTVTKFTVTGYASPEGNFNSNKTLSENRAKAFLSYLKEKFGYNVSSIESRGLGEDWQGLYAIVQNTDMEDKATVLDIIANTENIARRKSQLQTLSGGATYKYMLANLYPPLRRNVYEISFIARGFDVNEAREVVKTRPQLLSQNELFLVAETYQKGSEEFKEIFRIAGTVFPQDPYANINYGAIALEEGQSEVVVQRLQAVDMPEAYNNLAIAYFNIGATELAEKYFRMAVDAGSREAVANLAEFEKWKENF